jgi:hypothetical protein
MIGLGPGSQPHLKSLQDLHVNVDLRWAICRHPHKADRSGSEALETHVLIEQILARSRNRLVGLGNVGGSVVSWAG